LSKSISDGALLELYKGRVAHENGQTKGVTHWNIEVRNLVECLFVTALFHTASRIAGWRWARWSP